MARVLRLCSTCLSWQGCGGRQGRIRQESILARVRTRTTRGTTALHLDQIDSITMQAAREHLVKEKPRVLFIGLGETDEWAHGRRYDRYLHAAHRADDFLRRLWELVQTLPEYRDQTTIIFAPDHGRGATIRDWTDHGAKIEGAEYIWLGVIGPDTPPLGVRSDVEVTLSHVAATLAQAVGEDFCASSPKSAKPLPDAIRSH